MYLHAFKTLFFYLIYLKIFIIQYFPSSCKTILKEHSREDPQQQTKGQLNFLCMMHRVGFFFLSVKLCACLPLNLFSFSFCVPGLIPTPVLKSLATHSEFLESNSCMPYPGRNQDKLISKGKELGGVNWDIANHIKHVADCLPSPFLYNEKKGCVSKLREKTCISLFSVQSSH